MSEHQRLHGVPYHRVNSEDSVRRVVRRPRETDSAYYSRRASEELALATGRDDEVAASLHRDLAARYERLAAAKRDAQEGF
jgi:hypothetical protein